MEDELKIQLNGMKLLDFSEFYLATIQKYLVIVFCEDISTGMKKEYANFLDDFPNKNELAEIMRTGFKPYQLRNWLTEVL